MPIGTLGEGRDEPRERVIIVQPMQEYNHQQNYQNQQNQPMPEYPQQQNPSPQELTMSKRLALKAKYALLNFHQGMMARKRNNAEMKRNNPKKYARLVAQRKKKYNVMKTPSLFDGKGNGRMQW